MGNTLIKFDGKAIEKLIDVVAKGIGTLYKARSIKKEADAKAYEIEVIEKAKTKAKINNLELGQDALDRMEERIHYKEIKKQNNVDNIIYMASENLNTADSVSEEPLDDDWITRFFNIAEDISNPKMQVLWSRILTGEISKPKSYSLRTLELLRNLSQEEAEVFVKVASLALTSGNYSFVINPDNGKYLEDTYQINFLDKLILEEAGLIAGKENLELSLMAATENRLDALSFGKKCLVLQKIDGVPEQKLQIIAFSKVGRELLSLIESKVDNNYLTKLIKLLKHNKIQYLVGDISMNNNQTQIINLKDFQINE